MFKKVFVILVLVLSVAHAQANPLQQLFSAASRIGQSVTQGTTSTIPLSTNNSQTTNEANVPSDAQNILNTLADSSVGLSLNTACYPKFFDQEERATIAKLKSGDFAMAGAGAKYQAQEVAFCAVKRQVLPMSLAAQIAGQNLALSATAFHLAGMDTSETVISAQNALTLLNLDSSKNADLIKQLKNSGALPAAPVMAEDKASQIMTAVEATSKFMANSFAFNHRYNGKTLQITGVVQGISGGNTAFITLSGVPKKDPGLNDEVTCNITRPAFIGAAEAVSKRQTITIQGIYTVPQQSWMQAGVALQDCRIVN